MTCADILELGGLEQKEEGEVTEVFKTKRDYTKFKVLFNWGQAQLGC